MGTVLSDWPIFLMFLIGACVIASIVFAYGKTVQGQIYDDRERIDRMHRQLGHNDSDCPVCNR